MPEEILVSYAQNGEDIVLWRALGHLASGTYVDVGGWDPDVDSVTRLFYERGWRGVDVEPIPEFAERFRSRRAGNEVVEAVITDEPPGRTVLHRFGASGLSTVDERVADRHDEAGLEREDIVVPSRSLDHVLEHSTLVDGDIHFLKIDVEGSEEQVLRSVDLSRWLPWVLVVEATEPNSTVTTHEAWEPIVLAAGYTFTLFDGLSRFYVSPDHLDLAAQLSYPACALDEFQRVREVELHQAVAVREEELRTVWTELSDQHADAERARREAAQLGTELALANERLERMRERVQRLRTQRQRLRATVRTLRARSRRRLKRIRRLQQAASDRDAMLSPGTLRGRAVGLARRLTSR